MNKNQTLDEARKYLLYVSDALHSVAQAYSTAKEDRSVLEKFASDIFDYSQGLDQLKTNIIAKEQTKKKLEIVAELESTYQNRKKVTANAAINVRIIKSVLEKAKKSGIEKDIEEAKRRVIYYNQQYDLAMQLEAKAKKDLERG